jgi:hypothetical protein
LNKGVCLGIPNYRPCVGFIYKEDIGNVTEKYCANNTNLRAVNPELLLAFERDRLEDQGKDGRIVLKGILETWFGICELD